MRYQASKSLAALESKQIDGFVRQIVETSLPRVRRRISAEIVTMSASELRGYLRARTLDCVRDQLQQITDAPKLDAAFAEKLLERALERVVNLLLRELMGQPPLLLPIYEAPQRAAA